MKQSLIFFILTTLIEFSLLCLIISKISFFLLIITILLILGVIGLFVITFNITCSIEDWETNKRDIQVPVLTYAEFISLFQAIPQSFELRNSYIVYEYWENGYTGYRNQRVEFKTYIDYLKYKRFYIQYNKDTNKKIKAEVQQKFEDQIKLEQQKGKKNE